MGRVFRVLSAPFRLLGQQEARSGMDCTLDLASLKFSFQDNGKSHAVKATQGQKTRAPSLLSCQ